MGLGAYYKLLFAIDRDAERYAIAPFDARKLAYAPLQIRGEVIAPANDDEILQATANEEPFACHKS